MLLWRIIEITTIAVPEQEIAIVDQVGLSQYLSEADHQSLHASEPLPIPLPTGIYFYSLELPDTHNISFSAYIWQKYDEVIHQGISRGISLPQTIGYADITEIYRGKAGEVETIGWRVVGVLPQRFDYSRYPIDTNWISLIIKHPEPSDNVLLIPDLESYSQMRPSFKPGILPSLWIPGFIIEKSFFTVGNKPLLTDFGIHEKNKIVGASEFKYNIILRRDILEFLNITLLPLLVILVAVFCFLAATIKEPTSTVAIGSYIALAFAIILMHSSLRGRYQTDEILYVEYFFFSSYITLAILMLHSVAGELKNSFGKRVKESTPYLLALFWPLQFAAWFAMTFLTFFG
jgi:hypothetical protein